MTSILSIAWGDIDSNDSSSSSSNGGSNSSSSNSSSSSNNGQCKTLFSTSFDKSVRIWDIEKSECLISMKLKGFGSVIRTFASSSSSHTNGCAVAICNNPEIVLVDSRQSSFAETWEHATVPTALCCLAEGYVLICDERGIITTYDTRNLKKGPIGTTVLLEGAPPVRITDLVPNPVFTPSSSMDGKDTAQNLILAQCADNCLRVLNFGLEQNNSNTDVEMTSKLQLVHAFRGHISGEMIRAAFFRGQQYDNNQLLTWSRYLSNNTDQDKEKEKKDEIDEKKVNDTSNVQVTWSNSLVSIIFILHSLNYS